MSVFGKIAATVLVSAAFLFGVDCLVSLSIGRPPGPEVPALAVLGLAVHHPFGLRLDRGENVFHLLVGPITLALGLVATRVERQSLNRMVRGMTVVSFG